MNRQISFRQYRWVDLSILLIILAASQTLIHFACTRWFSDQLYVVSPIAAVTALVLMRWNGYGAIHAVLGGILFTALSGGGWQQYLIYGVGNAAGVLALVMFRLSGKEKIRSDALLSMAFGLCVQLLMWLGRGVMALLVGYPPEAFLGFITTDVLSGIFTLFVILAVRKADGLFEDQKSYLLRQEAERQAERRDQF